MISFKSKHFSKPSKSIEEFKFTVNLIVHILNPTIIKSTFGLLYKPTLKWTGRSKSGNALPGPKLN